MIKPEKMQKVRIIGLRKDEPHVISTLHELGLLEITAVDTRLNVSREKLLDVYFIVSEHLTRIRGIRSTLIPLSRGKKRLSLEEAISKSKYLVKLEERIKLLEAKREMAESRIDDLLEQHSQLKKIQNLDIDLGRLYPSKYTESFIGTIKRKNYQQLKNQLGQNVTLSIAHSEEGGYACAICASKKENIRQILEKSGFEFISIPPLTGTPKENLLKIEKEAEALRKSLEEINEEYLSISEEHWEQIDSIDRALKIWEARCVKVSEFGATQETFIAEGWCTAKNYHRLETGLKKVFGKRIFIKQIEGGEPPTKLSNPKPVRPFEFLVEFFSLPKAWEIDPSSILAFTFPFIYGMMVGDVGYGLISLVFALLLISLTKSPMLQGFAKLWALAAIPSIVFGIFFDEWFGFTFESFMHELGFSVSGSFLKVFFNLDIHLSRLHDIKQLIFLSVIVGILHLILGLFLGFLNERDHSRAHAIAKLGWIGLLIAGILLVPNLMFKTSLLHLPFDEVIMGAILFAVSLIAIINAEGIVGVFEIPSIAGNALSYSRIAAVGLAGVVVAEAIINKLIFEGVALPNKENALLFIVLVFIVFFLHAINTFLAMFESLVQGARLNLVEFYGKFFHGGGKRFSPFSMEER
ncbi:MAG: V-type ATP synthase subunit I [Candidatus Anstonellales archaeon]